MEQLTAAPYEGEAIVGRLSDGGSFGGMVLAGRDGKWPSMARAATAATLLAPPVSAYKTVADQYEALRSHVQKRSANGQRPTFTDYELNPREYELSLAQTVLKVHTRVANLYNEPTRVPSPPSGAGNGAEATAPAWDAVAGPFGQYLAARLT